MNRLSLICLLIIPITHFAVAQESEPQIDPVASKELIRQWVQTERLLSEEKNSWLVEKKRMQDLLDLYQKELTLLSEEIEKAGASAGLVDENKEKYESGLKQYRAAQAVLSDTMARLLPRMKAIIKRLPKPLRDEVEADVDLLQQENTLEKPRDVLKSMIAVLTAAGRFNRSITVAEETRDLPDGKKMTTDVLYLGLCRAYYTTSSGNTAGIGVPGKGTWQWTPQPDLADDILKAIAVYKKDQQPQLIKLPVQIQTGDSNK